MVKEHDTKAYFHLPGLFEFYEFYKVFLNLFHEHREYFYDWCEIGSIYGSPTDCLWGGGRVEVEDVRPEEVYALMREYGISARLTFSNSLLREEHLLDKRCNRLAELFLREPGNGVIIYSDLLLDYLKSKHPSTYFVSSTTKVLTGFDDLIKELNREDFKYVVPDFRLNKNYERLEKLSQLKKDKVEFLCNECCSFTCKDRKICYEDVSHKNLSDDYPEHRCTSSEAKKGYRFSAAMKNPGFISIEDIEKVYIPMGFSNFKIEGRSLGSALILEFLLYYMTKPEYYINVREEIYLDSTLDIM